MFAHMYVYLRNKNLSKFLAVRTRGFKTSSFIHAIANDMIAFLHVAE